MSTKYLVFLSCVLCTMLGFADELDNLIDPNIYENKYGKYYIPLYHNRPATKSVKRGKVYEQETLNFIEKMYKKGTSVVHAGTYFGDMLPFFSRLVGNQQVWAFEPVRLNYVCAQANIELNGLKNINLFNMGLSDKRSELIMRVINSKGTPCGGGSHIITYEALNHALESEPEDRFEVIACTSIDEMLVGNFNEISIIHLDVEGHEVTALKGAKQTINTYRPILIVEVWDYKANEIAQYMKEINYKKILELNGNAIYLPNESSFLF